MKLLSTLFLALALLLAVACAGESPTPTPDLPATVQAAVATALPRPTPTPKPDIGATVAAGIAATVAAAPTPRPTPDIDATVDARMAATIAAMPTPTPIPKPTPTPVPTPTPTVTPTPTLPPTKSPAELLSEMVKQARPAVVRIQTGAGSGSGVIFETQAQTGYVITNHHVVEGASLVSVIINDSTTYRGTVRGTDPVRDLAVVSICCGRFHALPFGDASRLEPGEEVVAIGYALGLRGEATITRGIVSAIRYDSRHQSNVIQTDAAINPGNSGGPMLSMSGQILGINTFRIDESITGRSAEGLGFAISETTVQSRIPVLRVGTPAATPVPTRRPPPTPSPSPGSGFGPLSGDLRHDPSDDLIEIERAGVSIANIVVESTFVNPYSSNSNSWDYGFILRRERNDRAIHIVLTSDRNWSLAWRETPSSDNQQLGSGTLSDFNTSAGGRNRLRVVAIGERGWLFVNGEFISTLDLSDVTQAGDVAVITGAYEGDEVAGAVTRFEDFIGLKLNKRYGPAAGRLEKEPGFVAEHDSRVWTRDLVAEAEFVNPMGTEWDYGFIIRNPELNRLEVIGLTGAGRWFHYTLDIGDGEYTQVADGRLPADFLNKNHLLVLAVGETGLFLLNGQPVAKLDLSHNLDYGSVSVMGDFFLNHQGSPEFENFNVWAP